MKKYFSALILFVSIISGLCAQSIKDETIVYNYIKLPSNPLDRNIKNYQASIVANYANDNAEKKTQYDAEYKIALADFEKDKKEYPAKVKAAEDSYVKEMEEWNKKSLGEKLIEKQVLNQNNKPVKQLPPVPSMRYVAEPDLKTTYDFPALCNTYFNLEGFNNSPDNAINIVITFYGYDYTQPHQLSNTKDMTRYANGQTTNYKATYYYTEFTYRHAMSVKVSDASGHEILNVTPQELNNYKTYKSTESEIPPQINSQQLVKSFEEKILQENLKFINNLLNDQFGYKRTERKTELYYVKSKGDEYKGLLVAFNEASSGLKTLIDDAQPARTKITSALQAWNAALQQSDVKDKKARIDKDVTIALCFNLLEAFFAMGNAENADKIFTMLNGIEISNSDRKIKESYEALFNDFKKRVKSNN